MLKPGADTPISRGQSPFPLTAVDQQNLTQNDDTFEPHTWGDIRQTIADNKLEVFKRWPSDLRRYMKWSTDIKARYGSVQTYVMKERLGWTPSPATTSQSGPLFAFEDSVPFRNSHDYKILPNDWPYGLEPGITHLIVWLKTRMEPEPVRGDMTPKARTQAAEFVQWKFIDRVKELPGHEEKVLWFKNWTALQSVPGMDHIHVLVRDVPQDIIKEWTGDADIVQ